MYSRYLKIVRIFLGGGGGGGSCKNINILFYVGKRNHSTQLCILTKHKKMLKYLLTFELLHCKYQYLQILVVYGQMLALFTSAVGFYDHLFA